MEKLGCNKPLFLLFSFKAIPSFEVDLKWQSLDHFIKVFKLNKLSTFLMYFSPI